jgi:hypothetical protein
LLSGAGALFADLPTTLDSIFLFVTGAFNCTDADFAAILGKDFSVGLTADLEAAFGAALETVFGDAALLDDFRTIEFGATLTLPFGLTLTVFTATVVVFDAIDLAEAGFAFFAEDVWVFADFFIAFAMESTTKRLLVLHGKNSMDKINYCVFYERDIHSCNIF